MCPYVGCVSLKIQMIHCYIDVKVIVEVKRDFQTFWKTGQKMLKLW